MFASAADLTLGALCGAVGAHSGKNFPLPFDAAELSGSALAPFATRAGILTVHECENCGRECAIEQLPTNEYRSWCDDCKEWSAPLPEQRLHTANLNLAGVFEGIAKASDRQLRCCEFERMQYWSMGAIAIRGKMRNVYAALFATESLAAHILPAESASVLLVYNAPDDVRRQHPTQIYKLNEVLDRETLTLDWTRIGASIEKTCAKGHTRSSKTAKVVAALISELDAYAKTVKDTLNTELESGRRPSYVTLCKIPSARMLAELVFKRLEVKVSHVTISKLMPSIKGKARPVDSNISLICSYIGDAKRILNYPGIEEIKAITSTRLRR